MKLEGIVLFSTEYKESSKIVNLYTPLGKMSVIAKGALNPKKGFLGFITTGNIVSFVTTDTNIKSLTEYSLLKTSFDINSSLELINVFSNIMEIIKLIPDDIDHKRAYEFIKMILLNLNNNKNPKKLLSIFLIKMLYIFGVAPNLKSCVLCGNNNVVSFSIAHGGALCNNCSNNDSSYLKIWQEYYYDKKDLDLYSDTDFPKLLKNIKDYYNFHMGIELKI